jgi:adenylate kinase
MDIETRVLPNILITGTPGVGKSTLSRLLCEYVPQLRYFNIGEIINQSKLYKLWDDKFNCPIFDEDMVIDFLENEIQSGGCVIDFHTSGVN